MTRVKICGITNLKDALCAVKSGANALGFVFYRKSPRYINSLRARKIVEKLPVDLSCVGVFVNEKEKQVKKIAKYCGLNILQFHGDETPGYCAKFKEYKIIKAFRVKDMKSLKNIKRFKVDAYLFDAFSDRKFGGTGRTFNWNIIKRLSESRIPVILSGGLNPDNIQNAIKNVSPYAVDISSGVEAASGKKDHKLLKNLFSKITKIHSSPKKPRS